MGGLTMSSPAIIELPEVTDGNTLGGDHFIVTVFNNDHNTWDEVVDILMKATACSLDEAEIETWEIDHLGKSVVHHGDRGECDAAAEVIRQIGIRVEVSEE
jgi:ATP-dependent Clp protease adapter protein ClpS